jgi:uncharacterized protein
VCLAAAASAVDWQSYRRQGCVNDFAGVIDATSKTQIEHYCSAVQRATGVDIVLIALNSVEGEPVDEVARAFFRGWRDPAKPQDRRVLLLLAVANRLQYATASDGLQPLSADVIREIRPALRRHDYNEAFRAAAETVGDAAARSAHAKIPIRLPRSLRYSFLHAISWPAVAGAAVILAALIWFGAPAGYGGFGGRGILPLVFRRRSMRRSSWGSRGSGGFGGYDSGDSTAGLGGAACHDW